MSIAITSVLSSSTADPADIRVVKAALNRLGLYQPDRDIGITAFTDAALFDGIRAFQKQKNLPVTGVIRPDDATARTLIWRTVQDDKVRSSHAGRNGQIFTEGRLPQGGHPGEEFGCRCWREAVSTTTLSSDPTLTDPMRDAIEPVYPIESILGGGILIKAGAKIAGNFILKRSVKLSAEQIKRKYKHADIFGLSQNYNRQNARTYYDALKNHIQSPPTQMIRGAYRGQKAIHFYNPKTGINVIVKTDGEFLSAWVLNPERAKILIRTGKL